MRVTRCDIDPGSLRCTRCGVHVTRPMVIRDCAGRRLGDIFAAVLSAIGITKERVEAVVGGPCGCDQRAAALNDIGARYLGIGRVDPPA